MVNIVLSGGLGINKSDHMFRNISEYMSGLINRVNRNLSEGPSATTGEPTKTKTKNVKY